MTTHEAPAKAQIWLCGRQYDRCESTIFSGDVRCADKIGHDGKHYNRHHYWMTSEQGRPSLAYDDSGDMVPGWHDSPEGQADAADQVRWDRQETRTNG